MTAQVYITGISEFLPNLPVANDELDRYLGTLSAADRRARNVVLARNGIKTRHYALDPERRQPTHTNVELAAEAARRALHEAGVTAPSVELLCCAASCPDQIIPSQALMVQGELELPAVEAISHAGVCCSSVASVKHAWLSLRTGDHRCALVTASENPSAGFASETYQVPLGDDAERALSDGRTSFEGLFLRWMLSDGAGAVVLETTPRRGGLSLRLDAIELWSYAHLLPPCMYFGGRYERDGRFRCYKGSRLMAKGPELLDMFTIRQEAGLLDKHIMERSADALGQFVRKYELPTRAPMWILPHISSHYFYRRCLAALAAHVAVDEARVFTNLASKGNTGSAAWLIMLAELVHGGRLSPGERILCAIPESARFTAGFAAFTVVGDHEAA